MSLTYTTYVNSIVNLMPVASSTTPEFVTVLPNIIDDAEQRMYRELDLLNTITRDASAALSAGSRTFNLPAANGTFITVDNINVVTPAGQSNPDLGTRNPVVPSSRDMLNAYFPSVAGSAVPVYFAMLTQSSIVLGPWPDQSYQVEVVGTIRPPVISTTNTTTLLSVYFPDMLIAASMVFASGYMKNFGAQADDPRMAQSWETHYQTLLSSAQTEEARKKFTQAGWSSKSPSPQATPPRT